MATFEAQYRGKCAAACGSSIEPGDLVLYVDDELVHEACEGRGLQGRRPAEVCKECWLEKPCGCEDGQ